MHPTFTDIFVHFLDNLPYSANRLLDNVFKISHRFSKLAKLMCQHKAKTLLPF